MNSFLSQKHSLFYLLLLLKVLFFSIHFFRSHKLTLIFALCIFSMLICRVSSMNCKVAGTNSYESSRKRKKTTYYNCVLRKKRSFSSWLCIKKKSYSTINSMLRQGKWKEKKRKERWSFAGIDWRTQLSPALQHRQMMNIKLYPVGFRSIHHKEYLSD